LQSLLCPLLGLYTLALIARAVLSWFPVSPGSGMIPVLRALDTVIDPVLQPLRRVIPRAGMFDLSFFVLIILVELIHGALCPGHGFF
jgi:YggT family protein